MLKARLKPVQDARVTFLSAEDFLQAGRLGHGARTKRMNYNLFVFFHRLTKNLADLI